MIVPLQKVSPDASRKSKNSKNSKNSKRSRRQSERIARQENQMSYYNKFTLQNPHKKIVGITGSDISNIEQSNFHTLINPHSQTLNLTN